MDKDKYIRSDQEDTVIMDRDELLAEIEREASFGQHLPAESDPETASMWGHYAGSEHDAAPTRNITSGASRSLYAVLMIATMAAGTLAGLLGSVTVGIAGLRDVFLEEGYHGDSPWLVEFADEHAQSNFISDSMWKLIVLTLVVLAAIIGLSIMTGRFRREEDGSIHLNRFDRIWSEIHIFLACCAATFAVMCGVPIAQMVPFTGYFGTVFTPSEIDPYHFELSNTTVLVYCLIGMALCILVTVICIVTLVKKLKAHKLLEKSLLGRIFRLLGIGAAAAGEGASRAGRGIRGAWRSMRSSARSLTVPADTDRGAVIKIMLKYIAIAWALILIPGWIVIVTRQWGIYVLLQIAALITATCLIVRKVRRLCEIRAGVIEVKSGNLSHKITVEVDENGPKTDLDKLASDINHISEATNNAVQNEIKNQRLKTDLISNVSHDLKTPLTSMISYLDILSKEGLDSPDAPAHLAIVQEKTERLKTLTEDLFEAAKASSGNIPCEIEKIDAASLIDQSLAEMGDRLSRKKLKIRKNIRTDNTMVLADGKLLYRVLENLLGNISKYALDKSRVYIDVSDATDSNTAAPERGIRKDRLIIEIKNISRDELNISADELMERFTRGDQSRNTEGSGLGLAIAKDLVNLMGGVFRISIDGDMFKASILLNRP